MYNTYYYDIIPCVTKPERSRRIIESRALFHGG